MKGDIISSIQQIAINREQNFNISTNRIAFCYKLFAKTKNKHYLCSQTVGNIMESLFRTHDHLLRHRSNSVRRFLVDEIDPSERLIGIVGSRGIGKTTFLIDWAVEQYGVLNRKCLYVNLNHFLFSTTKLVDFAASFVQQGGEMLLLDQIFKYPNWQSELNECYQRFPSLKIMYTGSPLVEDTLDEQTYKGKIYKLPGFSLREYINSQTGLQLPIIRWEDIINNHVDISKTILEKVNPNSWFNDYVHHGYYPFFLAEKTYSESLLKNINMTLEVDVMYIRNIDQRLLPKLRTLLYLISLSSPTLLNVSQLAKGISTSRATVTNYVNFLKEAELISLVHRSEATEAKSSLISYLDNTNLGYVLAPESLSEAEICRTFFLNQVSKSLKIEATVRAHVNFVVDSQYQFRVDKETNVRYRLDRLYAVNNISVGVKNIIPLWLFGFLY